MVKGCGVTDNTLSLAGSSTTVQQTSDRGHQSCLPIDTRVLLKITVLDCHRSMLGVLVPEYVQHSTHAGQLPVN